MFDIQKADPTGKVITLESLLKQETVKERFEQVVGKRAQAFMSSIITTANSNSLLAHCEPRSILASAMMAAVLDLPIENNLGFAYIVPYRSKDGDRAQFQIGYKGLTQLALRSGMYERINTAVLRDGQSVDEDAMTGEIKVAGRPNEWDAPAFGYLAYLKLKNGFEHTVYMTKEQIEAHAKKYSKSWGRENSAWVTAFDQMALKTVLRNLLTHYGIMSIEMQKAFTAEDNESEREINDWVSVQSKAAESAWKEPIDAVPSDAPAETVNHPLPAGELREQLRHDAKQQIDFIPSKDQLGLMNGMLNFAFAPNPDSDKIRRSCLRYLWGVDSSKKLTGPQVKATLDWLAPAKMPDGSGEYAPDPMAVQELHAVWTAAQEEAGQQKLI